MKSGVKTSCGVISGSMADANGVSISKKQWRQQCSSVNSNSIIRKCGENNERNKMKRQ
jgi:hypothetical protein